MNWQPSDKAGDAVIDADDQSDASCNAYYGGRLVAESVQRSNRPLIAAAPDLRDALEYLLETSMRTPAWLEEKHGMPFQLIVEAAAEKALVALEKVKVKS